MWGSDLGGYWIRRSQKMGLRDKSREKNPTTCGKHIYVTLANVEGD